MMQRKVSVFGKCMHDTQGLYIHVKFAQYMNINVLAIDRAIDVYVFLRSLPLPLSPQVSQVSVLRSVFNFSSSAIHGMMA